MEIYIDKPFSSLVISKRKVPHGLFHFSFLPTSFFFHLLVQIWVKSLGQEDPLEEGIATHPSIIAWRIPWTEEPGRAHGCMCHRMHGLSSCNSWSLEHRLSSCAHGPRHPMACGILLGSGIEPASPELAGRLLTTKPPEKPLFPISITVSDLKSG